MLLRYGKTWTQEPTCEAGVSSRACRRQVADASFTSIAFSGSQAIVAYRTTRFRRSRCIRRRGARQQRLGLEHRRRRGGAELAGGARGGRRAARWRSRVRERRRRPGVRARIRGRSWQTTPPPYPAELARLARDIPRRGGAEGHRSGAVPETVHSEEEEPPPAGFPPTLVTAYPLAQPPAYGCSARQAAVGAKRNTITTKSARQSAATRSTTRGIARSQLGRADHPTGNEGWAVGGFPGTARRAASKPRTSRAMPIQRPKARRRLARKRPKCRSNQARPSSRSEGAHNARARARPSATPASDRTPGCPQR